MSAGGNRHVLLLLMRIPFCSSTFCVPILSSYASPAANTEHDVKPKPAAFAPAAGPSLPDGGIVPPPPPEGQHDRPSSVARRAARSGREELRQRTHPDPHSLTYARRSRCGGEEA